jgi:hypothetical protein
MSEKTASYFMDTAVKTSDLTIYPPLRDSKLVNKSELSEIADFTLTVLPHVYIRSEEQQITCG